MTFEQINLLTIEPLIPLLIDRYCTRNDLDPELGLTQEELEAEFLFYKQELILEEQSRLDEIQRKELLINRWKDIKARDGGMSCFRILKPDVINMKKYVNSLIEDKSRADEAELFMQQLEAKDLEIVQNQNNTAYIDLRRKAYPEIESYLDAMVKINSGDEILIAEGQQQLADYYTACLAVKSLYPKP
ncbi:MAG TPA: hypothetical protein VI911_11465 [Patescibacteria group bacterium]|nr:hypothetical protein [Patescibacteria group bacterium]